MSNTPIKNGKKPLSSKPKQLLTDSDVFGDMLSIPPHVQADLDAKGLVGRWIDAQELYKMGGYHRKGWVAYKAKFEASDTMNADEFRLGRDPEGVIRRGSLILGVKSKEQVELHRELLKQKNARTSKALNKSKAQELEQFAKSAAADVKVYEGYEEND